MWKLGGGVEAWPKALAEAVPERKQDRRDAAGGAEPQSKRQRRAGGGGGEAAAAESPGEGEAAAA